MTLSNMDAGTQGGFNPLRAFAMLLLMQDLSVSFNHFSPGAAPQAGYNNLCPVCQHRRIALSSGRVTGHEVRDIRLLERRQQKSSQGQETLYILDESGPFVAAFKPKGLSSTIWGLSDARDTVAGELARKLGGEWQPLQQFRLPNFIRGVVVSAKVAEASAAEQILRNEPVELWFDVVAYTAIAQSFLEHDELLQLPALGVVAKLCKTDEGHELKRFSANVVLPASSSATSGMVARGLIDALAAAGSPVLGSSKNCHKFRKLKGVAISLARVRCTTLDAAMPPDLRHARLLAREREFFTEETERNAQHLPALIEILTNPQVADPIKYAPMLQQIGLRRLGPTYSGVRAAMDALNLPSPDPEWASHATAQLEAHYLQQWKQNTSLRHRLQYGAHTSWLLCCYMRVQCDGHLSRELLVRSPEIQNITAANAHPVGSPFSAIVLGHARDNHCDVQALSEAYALCTRHSSSGEGCTVDLMGAHYPCVSCVAVMRHFATKLPKAQLRIGFCKWSSIQRALLAALTQGGDED